MLWVELIRSTHNNNPAQAQPTIILDRLKKYHKKQKDTCNILHTSRKVTRIRGKHPVILSPNFAIRQLRPTKKKTAKRKRKIDAMNKQKKKEKEKELPEHQTQ